MKNDLQKWRWKFQIWIYYSVFANEPNNKDWFEKANIMLLFFDLIS